MSVNIYSWNMKHEKSDRERRRCLQALRTSVLEHVELWKHWTEKKWFHNVLQLHTVFTSALVLLHLDSNVCKWDVCDVSKAAAHLRSPGCRLWTAVTSQVGSCVSSETRYQFMFDALLTYFHPHLDCPELFWWRLFVYWSHRQMLVSQNNVLYYLVLIIVTC